jgi:Tol biopolymer transport system component
MLRGPTGQLSPDGTRIAYVWNVETASHRVNNELRVSVIDGNGDTAIYSGAPDERIVLSDWTTDGAAVVFERRAGETSELALVTADGGSPERLWTLESGTFRAQLSPDRRFVAFERWHPADLEKSGHNDIATVNLRTGATVDITYGPANDTWPRWTPDSDGIVFLSGRDDGYWLIFHRLVDGRPVHPATEVHNFGDERGVLHGFSADGALFVRTMPPGLTVYRVAIDVPGGRVTGVPERVVQGTASGTLAPAWGPDGAVAYLSGLPNTAGARLTVAKPNAPPLDRFLPNRLLFNSGISWSPDGRLLAVSYGGPADRPGRPTLLLADAVTLDASEVVGPANMRSPKWDDTGRLYVLRGGRSVWRVAADASDFTGAELIYDTPGDHFLRSEAAFAVTRSGDAVVVAAAVPTEPRDLWISHNAGCVVRVITPGGGYQDGDFFKEACNALEWTSDGQHILLATHSSGSARLWRLDRAGRNRILLSADIGSVHDMSLDASGTRLLFASDGGRRATFRRVVGIGKR